MITHAGLKAKIYPILLYMHASYSIFHHSYMHNSFHKLSVKMTYSFNALGRLQLIAIFDSTRVCSIITQNYRMIMLNSNEWYDSVTTLQLKCFVSISCDHLLKIQLPRPSQKSRHFLPGGSFKMAASKILLTYDN